MTTYRKDLPVVHCDRCRGPIYRGERFVSTRRGTGAVHPRCASTVSWPAMFGIFAAVVLVAVLGLLVLGLAVRGLL